MNNNSKKNVTTEIKAYSTSTSNTNKPIKKTGGCGCGKKGRRR